VAVVRGSVLAVANVGDSRGVLCDVNGKTHPLSFDHKPHEVLSSFFLVYLNYSLTLTGHQYERSLL